MDEIRAMVTGICLELEAMLLERSNAGVTGAELAKRPR